MDTGNAPSWRFAMRNCLLFMLLRSWESGYEEKLIIIKKKLIIIILEKKEQKKKREQEQSYFPREEYANHRRAREHTDHHDVVQPREVVLRVEHWLRRLVHFFVCVWTCSGRKFGHEIVSQATTSQDKAGEDTGPVSVVNLNHNSLLLATVHHDEGDDDDDYYYS